VAQFKEGEHYFSVVLHFCGSPDPLTLPHECEITPAGAGDGGGSGSVALPGARFHLAEGARLVADCEVLSVRTQTYDPQQPVFVTGAS